eukprot:1175257-Ditylum_brightwellii.AAC.1
MVGTRPRTLQDIKKIVRMLKLMKAAKKYQKKLYRKKTYKFCLQVSMTGDVRGTMKLDKENGNSLWFDAQKKEASTLRNMDTFELMPGNFDLTGYQYGLLIYDWDVKFDGRRRARLVANGKVTTRRRCVVWSDTKEMMYIRLGPELGDWADKLVITRKMRDASDHYEYVAKYIDDILIMSKDPMAILKVLQKSKGPYEFKGVESPKYYLGGDVKINYSGDLIAELYLSSKMYVNQICDKIEILMGWKLK